MFESDNAEGETAITVKLPKYDRIGKISVKVVKELAQGAEEENERGDGREFEGGELI